MNDDAKRMRRKPRNRGWLALVGALFSTVWVIGTGVVVGDRSG